MYSVKIKYSNKLSIQYTIEDFIANLLELMVDLSILFESHEILSWIGTLVSFSKVDKATAIVFMQCTLCPTSFKKLFSRYVITKCKCNKNFVHTNFYLQNCQINDKKA